MRATTQDPSFDADAFGSGIDRSLAVWAFRLVFVLDLVTVKSYEVGGHRILVPQRVEPGRVAETRSAHKSGMSGEAVADGGTVFEEMARNAPADRRVVLEQLLAWGRQLEQEKLVTLLLLSREAANHTPAPPQPEQVGLVSIWQSGALSLWWSVFERHASGFSARIETVTGTPMGTGTGAPVTAELLGVLIDAYREAAK